MYKSKKIIFVVFFVLQVSHPIFLGTVIDDWSKKLSTEIAQNVHPYQIILFSYKNEDIANYRSTMKHLASNRSIYRINLPANVPSRLKFFGNPRATTLYIIFKKAKDKQLYQNVEKILDHFESLSPVVTRPKCLLLLWGYLYSSKATINNILELSWKMKFLDFTIIWIRDSKSYPKVIYLNPFSYETVAFSLLKNSKIFPDKLLNVKNFTVNLMVGQIEGQSEIVYDKNGELIDIRYRDMFVFIKQFCRYVNFDINYQLMLVTPAVTENLMRFHLFRGRVPFILYYYSYKPNFHKSLQHELSRFHFTTPVEIFVPPVKRTTINIDSAKPAILILFYWLLFITIYTLIRTLKFSKSSWKRLNILKMLLGMNAFIRPRNRREKIGYMLLALLSLKLSADFFDNFMNVSIAEDLVIYETLEDIDKTNLSIALREDYFEYFTDNDSVVQNLRKKSFLFSWASRLKLSKPFILIGTKEHADYARWVMKFCAWFCRINNSFVSSNVTLLQTGLGIPMERSSPYVEKFNKVYLRTCDSGIGKSPDIINQRGENSTMDREDNFSASFSMLFIMRYSMIGLFLAIVVFGLEKFIFFAKNRSNRILRMRRKKVFF